LLNGSRTSEVIGALWSEIDTQQRVWTVPAERMKAGKVHRVPLSDAAIALLRSLPREADNPYLFIGSQQGASLEKRAMYRFLRKLGRKDITVHGFRSAFTDWAHDTTAYPKVVIDMAAAHAVGDKVEAAYRRGELLEKRRRLMADWSRYCTTSPVKAAGVVQLRAKR
jgi:integrase